MTSLYDKMGILPVPADKEVEYFEMVVSLLELSLCHHQYAYVLQLFVSLFIVMCEKN